MYDLAVKNGLIVDGSRKKPVMGNVYVSAGKIAEISTEDKPAKEVYDAKGKVISPGFVDIHSHSDVAYLDSPTMQAKLTDGVTFELVGQCGISIIPTCDKNIDITLKTQASAVDIELTAENFSPRDVTTYAENISGSPISLNLGTLVGHGTLRSYVIGWEQRQLTQDELTYMCTFLDELLKQGALGLSLGLIYPPGSYCDTAEIVALAKVVAKHNKILAVHLRNENAGVFDALDEMIYVAKQSGVNLQVSHFKLMGPAQWGRTDELLAKVDLARAQGVRIHCDQYPFTASRTVLTSAMPKGVLAGGLEEFIKRLEDDEAYANIIKDGLPELYIRGGPDNVVVCETPLADYPEIINKSLTQIAEELGMPIFDAIRHILIKCKGRIQCFFHSMCEEDVLQIMRRMDICTCSDGSAYDLDRPLGHPHPRDSASFSRFLGLVRKHNLMPIQDAIYKITALPATLMGLGDKIGYIKVGHDANITVFDFDIIKENATYEKPTLKPDGISYVIVNGELALENNIATKARPGKMHLA